ncbi:MAG: AAA family ATPase [Candidatus Asgardarchaeia archaeon]
MMHDEEIKVDVKKFWVRNFKSLKDFELDLEKVNVLVGKNGSGKTNVIEALKLFKMIIDYFKGIEVNPFLEWWGYNNVVWKGNEHLQIIIGFDYVVEFVSYNEKKWKTNARYEIVLTGIGGDFKILKEKITVPSTIELINTPQSMEIILGENAKTDITFNSSEYFIADKIDSLYEPFRNRKNKAVFEKELIDELNHLFKEVVNQIVNGLKLKSSNSIFFLKEIANTYKFFPYEEEIDWYIDFVYGEVIYATLVNKIRSLLEDSRFYTNFKILYEIFEYAKSHKNSILIQKLINITLHAVTKLLMKSVYSVVGAIIGAHNIANKLIILKKLDYKSIRDPIKLRREDILAEDGSNLTAVLYSMGKGRIPERIDLAVKYAFGENCIIHIEPTSDGRAYIKFFERGFELNPPAIPDGLYKLIALEIALEYNAPIIAIDDFENSLYADVIRYILDELRNSSSKAILTTHSPAVMDFADPSEIVILKKDENGETKAYRFKKPQKIQELLKKEGITPSEYIIYKEMSTDKEL